MRAGLIVQTGAHCFVMWRHPIPWGSTTRKEIMSGEKALSWSYAEELNVESDQMTIARAQARELSIEAVSPGTGGLLRTLAGQKGIKHIAEIGTGTGVSGLALLTGSSESVLTSVDIDAEAQTSARANFTAAGIRTARFRLINGRSADILPRLADASYDLVLIDGDPFEAEGDAAEAMRMLRTGGLLLVARALYHDRVADPARRDDATVAIRNLGKDLAESDATISSLVPIGDGLIIAVKI